MARAGQEAIWPVKGKLKDDDEVQHAQYVIVDEGRIVAGTTIRLINDEHQGKPLELDGESVAYADGFYYVIGSHGHPRDPDHSLDPTLIKARIAASSQIARIRLNDNDTASVERSAKLREVISAQPELQHFMDRRLDDNGVTIEGYCLTPTAHLRAIPLSDYRQPCADPVGVC